MEVNAVQIYKHYIESHFVQKQLAIKRFQIMSYFLKYLNTKASCLTSPPKYTALECLWTWSGLIKQI